MTAVTEGPVETPPTRPAFHIGRLVAGLLIVGYGLVWLADRLEWIALSPGSLLPLALIGIGVALMVLAWDARHEGVIVLGVIVAVITVVAALAPVPAITSGVGDRTIVVTTIDQLQSEYRLGAGNLVLDLSDLTFDSHRTVHAEVGVGELRVIVPAEAEIRIEASSGIGEVRFFGERQGGLGVDHSYQTTGYSSERAGLLLKLNVGIGQVEVRR
jgi:hypothetical protein